MNKAPDFVQPTEEENKTALELKFTSDADVANMIYDRFQIELNLRIHIKIYINFLEYLT